MGRGISRKAPPGRKWCPDCQDFRDMTNQAFYAFCRDQRKVESDPELRGALTTIYNYMRECGVSKQGVAGFLDHCMQECAKNGSSPVVYQRIGRVFAEPGPKLAQTGQATLF